MKLLAICVTLFTLMVEIICHTTTIYMFGRGASSSLPLFYLWQSSFKTQRLPNVDLQTKYSPINSLRGIDEMEKPVNETSYAYGASDAFMTAAQYAEGPDLAMVPVVGSAVAICYNLPGIGQINMTREAIVGIYNGTISSWSDPLLTSINPTVTLPGKTIQVIARADYSGTTEIFTTALSAFSSAWNDTYGSFADGTDAVNGGKWNGTSVTLSGRQSRGVIGVLFTYKYSIGYLSIADAIFANFTYAKMFNSYGNLVLPNVLGTQEVMNATIGQMTDNLTAVMVDSPLPDAYPIIGYTYFIVHMWKMTDCNLAVELQRYLLWLMESPSAQDQADDFKMATITIGVDSLVHQQILYQMTCDGQSVWDLVQEQIDQEIKSTQKWRLPVFIISPLIAIVLLVLIGQNLWQKMKIRRAELSNDWMIPFSEIEIKWDGDNGWVGRSRAFGSSATYATSNSFMSHMRFVWAGVVDMLGVWNDQKVGLKRFPILQFNVDKRETKININTLRVTVLHTNVQRFFGVTYHENRWYLVREHAEKGSLTDVLQNSKYELDVNFKFVMALDVSQGMEFLHSQDIVHGKLNSTCCLLDGRWNVKISSWEIRSLCCSENISRSKTKVYPLDLDEEESQDPNVRCRAQVWDAPELLRNQDTEPGKQTDVYSFGILLVEIFSRHDPYQEKLDFDQPVQVISDILKKGARPSMEDIETDSICQIMSNCWKELPADRPTFAQLSKKINRVRPSRKSVIESMMETLENYVSHLEDMVEERTSELASVNNSLETLLHQILPPSVATRLSEGKLVEPEEYESVSVFFSDIVKFTDLSARSKPMDVVNLLNDLYTIFDAILEKLEVYKIDTIGDAYMVISGLPIRNGIEHAGHIATMATQLMSAVQAFTIRHKPGEKLQMRAGIHSGPVVAGVVGKKMPRYTLFGDTVNVASRMESNSLPMKIQATESTYLLLNQIGGFQLVHRGEIDIKGKGKMKTYWVDGIPTGTPVTKSTSAIQPEVKTQMPNNDIKPDVTKKTGSSNGDVKPVTATKNAKTL